MSSPYDNWDPMQHDYCSFGNLLRLDPGTLISGQTLRMRQDVCPHSRDGKTCFKGSRCPYKYHVDPKLVKENPILGIIGTKERVFCLNDLPLKPLGREGMMNIGVIVAAINPGEFYIVPMKSWECACKEGIETSANSSSSSSHNCHHGLNDGHTEHSHLPAVDKDEIGSNCKNGMEALNEIFRSLPEYTKKRSNDAVHYAANELVAVQLETFNDENQKQMLWFRAVVLEDVVLGDAQEAPKVLLRLLDIGLHVMKSIQHVIRLPKLFCHLPPLAYKCSLFGVSPLSHKWSRPAIETFKLLTEFQSCLFEVKRTIQLDDDGPPNLFEKNPYLVEINIRLEKKFYNVSHALASEGLAIQWNLTPSRPLVFATLNGELWNLLSAENNTPGQSLKSSVTKDEQNIVERERKRMKKLLGRLNIGVDDDDESQASDNSTSLISNSVEDLV